MKPVWDKLTEWLHLFEPLLFQDKPLPRGVRITICSFAAAVVFYATVLTGAPKNLAAAKWLGYIPSAILPAIYGLGIGILLGRPHWRGTDITLAFLAFVIASFVVIAFKFMNGTLL